MSKRNIIIAAVALVVLAAVGFAAYSQTKKPVSTSNVQSVQTEQKAQEPQTIKGSIKSLLSSGKNLRCEFSYPDSNIKGETYVSANKVRGDFTMSDPNQGPTTSHMFTDGTYAYMWMDGTSTGTKMKIDTLPSTSPSASGQSQSADLDKEVDMKCAPWNVDTSKFEVPANIQFTDLSAFIKPAGSAKTAPKVDSSLCDQIPDAAAKAACLKALNGN